MIFGKKIQQTQYLAESLQSPEIKTTHFIFLYKMTEVYPESISRRIL